MKMKNIAVVLRGHLRTWQYNAPAAFKFFDNVADNVDYYLCTWNTGNDLRHPMVERVFKKYDKKMKVFNILDIPNDVFSSWLGPAYLAMRAAPHIKQQHKKTPYDAVFETRFDVLPFMTPDAVVVPLQSNTWYTTAWTNIVDSKGNRNIGMEDHFLAGTVETFCAMADRIVVQDNDSKECHVDMREFAQSQGIIVSNSLPWMDAAMTRPSDMYRIRNPHTWEASSDIGRIEIDEEHVPDWSQASQQERIAMLFATDILASDYKTDNFNIAIHNSTELSEDSLDPAFAEVVLHTGNPMDRTFDIPVE